MSREVTEADAAYVVWIFDLSDKTWERTFYADELIDAYDWIREWETEPQNAVAIVWPCWAQSPTESP